MRDGNARAVMNDESRALRNVLSELCRAFVEQVADKDTIDFRLGSPEPYGPTNGTIDAEGVYERESASLSSNLREIVVKIADTAQQIRSIEGF